MQVLKRLNERLTFRKQLVLFVVLLVSIVAIPALIVEIQRPWEELDNLIAKGNLIIVGIEQSSNPGELTQLNDFALRINQLKPYIGDRYLSASFNLLVMDKQLLPEVEVNKIAKAKELDLQYEQLQLAWNFWQDQFRAQPELLPIFIKYKQQLVNAQEAAKKSDFVFNDIYIMTDSGDSLVFLINGTSWEDSVYPGQEYDVLDNDCPYFRDYLTKGNDFTEGFSSNPKKYHWGILPKFDTDQWGSWFSVWYATKKSADWNNFALDFDAGSVKALMQKIGFLIVGVTISLIAIIILLTRWLSLSLSLPVKNLIVGAQAISDGNYDSPVPLGGGQELRQLIMQHNDNLPKLKGRVLLKQVVERLLSPLLAERVENEGLILEGQEVEATILITDFADFSDICQGMEAREILNLLNEYFHLLEPIVRKHGGFITDFDGDSIIAIFGAPITLPNNGESAVSCAIEMQKAMRQINKQRATDDKINFEMRIGVYSGRVMVGALGGAGKIDYTAIGEPTNLAKRLETACEIGHILISEGTLKMIGGIFFENIAIDVSATNFDVKGSEKPVAAYNIYVCNLAITKKSQPQPKDENSINEQPPTQVGNYFYQPVNHNLKRFASLSQESQSKFTRVVTIN